MKILIYESDKGLAPYTYNVANELAKMGQDVIYMTSQENPYRSQLDKRVKDCCVLKQVSGKYKRRSLQWIADRLFKCFYNIYVRNRIVHKEKPDIVNIHSTIYSMDKFLLKKSKSTKYVMTVHNVEGHEKTYDEKSKIAVWKKQDGLVVHTPENVKELSENYGIKNGVYLVPHGADTTYEHIEKIECRKKYGISSDKTVLLSFGIVRDYKGTDILIDALSGIDNCVLLLAGKVDSAIKEQYVQKMNNNNIEYVWIDGFIKEEEIPYIFQCSDIAVLPYKYFNSQSGVLLRIATFNLPVIASDVGGFKRFVNHYHMGTICKPNDVFSLRQEITSMLTNGNREEFVEGAKKAAKDNSWEHAAECYLEAFAKVIH